MNDEDSLEKGRSNESSFKSSEWLNLIDLEGIELMEIGGSLGVFAEEYVFFILFS